MTKKIGILLHDLSSAALIRSVLPLICCAVLSTFLVSAQAQDVGSVEVSARRFAAAMEQHDAARLVALLTPEAVEQMKEAMGSKETEAVVKLLAEQYADGERMGIQTSVKLGPASEVGRTQGRLFRFIPYLVKNSVFGREPILGRSFLVAVSRDEGKTWLFFEGAGLKSHLGTTMLPGYVGNPLIPGPLPNDAYR